MSEIYTMTTSHCWDILTTMARFHITEVFVGRNRATGNHNFELVATKWKGKSLTLAPLTNARY